MSFLFKGIFVRYHCNSMLVIQKIIFNTFKNPDI